MKVNYDFYNEKYTYSDGEVENDIINYLKEYGEEGYKQIFEKDIRWPVFYHITPIRKNILNWYPFKENSEVLEIGAGMGAITRTLCDKVDKVTSVELSKQRATAIMERCKDKENLEIIVGNFNDIKFNKKFDYITLIGVLEYAPLYTKSDDPFYDFLIQIKSLLKEDGKLLIAIENQFGLKYFTGAPEDHTGKIYDGILGYENKNGIRTFGKVELTNILKRAGYRYNKFYYPLPDYKLPNIIFSDDYMPNENSIKDYTPYLSGENDAVNYDEKTVYVDIIKNNKFDFLANSFLVEASASEINTVVKLEEQSLVKIDAQTKKFYDNHYNIKKIEEKEENQSKNAECDELRKENEKLKEEINSIKYSRTWRYTNFIRKIRNKHSKR